MWGWEQTRQDSCLPGLWKSTGDTTQGCTFPSVGGRDACLLLTHAVNQHVLVSTCYAPATVPVYRAFRGTDKTPCPRGASILVGTGGRKHGLTPTIAWFLRENCCVSSLERIFFVELRKCSRRFRKEFKEVVSSFAQHHSPRNQVTTPLAWLPLSFPFPQQTPGTAAPLTLHLPPSISHPSSARLNMTKNTCLPLPDSTHREMR